MFEWLKNACLNTPIINVLCLIALQGVFIPHIMKQYQKQHNLSTEAFVRILREHNVPEEDIIKYLGGDWVKKS
jgi:hypothetical protein